MIRRVCAHIYDIHRACWRVHLACRHVVVISKNEHSRTIKGRFCPSCPGAERALMADLKNENEHEWTKLAKRLKERAEKS